MLCGSVSVCTSDAKERTVFCVCFCCHLHQPLQLHAYEQPSAAVVTLCILATVVGHVNNAGVLHVTCDMTITIHTHSHEVLNPRASCRLCSVGGCCCAGVPDRALCCTALNCRASLCERIRLGARPVCFAHQNAVCCHAVAAAGASCCAAAVSRTAVALQLRTASAARRVVAAV